MIPSPDIAVCGIDLADSNDESSEKFDHDDSSSDSLPMASDGLGRVGNLKGGYVKGQWTKEVRGDGS